MMDLATKDTNTRPRDAEISVQSPGVAEGVGTGRLAAPPSASEDINGGDLSSDKKGKGLSKNDPTDTVLGFSRETDENPTTEGGDKVGGHKPHCAPEGCNADKGGHYPQLKDYPAPEGRNEGVEAEGNVESQVESQALHDIQPLPSGNGNCSDPSRPGAHPVAGFGQWRSLAVTDTDAEVSVAGCTAASQGFLVIEQVEDGENLSDLEEAHATPLPERNANKMPHKWFCVVATVVAASLLVFLIVWLVLQSQPSNEGQVGTKTPEEMTNKNPPFQEDLSIATLRAIQEDPDSPESRANEWMWDDPYLEEYTKERQRQRFGMVALYFSTQGDQWSHNDNWLDYEVSECLWFSKATVDPVCDEQESILTLDLHSNNLNGTLPNDFWFTKPRHLNFANNFLQGKLPPFPSDSEQLEVLILSNNNFTGRIIGEAGLSVGNLRVCMIDSNSFFGSENGRIFPLIPKLEIFNSSSNHFVGPMSPNMQYLTNLRSFSGGYNQKKGPLVTEVGLLTKLEVLEYPFNTITGTIPTEFGLLTNLLHLNLDGTHLTGSLPEQFCVRQEQDLLYISVNCSSLECC